MHAAGGLSPSSKASRAGCETVVPFACKGSPLSAAAATGRRPRQTKQQDTLSIYLSTSLSLYTCACVIHVYTYVCIYIYIVSLRTPLAGASEKWGPKVQSDKHNQDRQSSTRSASRLSETPRGVEMTLLLLTRLRAGGCRGL